MRGNWLDGTTERKLFEHRKFETSITRQGITLFFNAAYANNYHKNFDKRISYRKRNGNALFTKRLGNVFDESESITYLPAHFSTDPDKKTNCFFPLTNDSTTEINDLAELKNDSTADTNGFAELKYDSAAVVNDSAGLKNDSAAVTNGFAEVKNDFADSTNDFAGLRNDFAELRNGFAAVRNDFAEVRNDFAGLKNDFADCVKPLFSLKNAVFRAKHAVLADYGDTTVFLWLKPIFDLPINPRPKGTWLCNCKFCREQVSRINNEIRIKKKIMNKIRIMIKNRGSILFFSRGEKR